jgi:hypothetical protein
MPGFYWVPLFRELVSLSHLGLMLEEGGCGHQHCVKSVSPRAVAMSSYSRPASRARRMAISLRADACLRAATMGEPAGTRRTTDDDAFPFFPLAPRRRGGRGVGRRGRGPRPPAARATGRAGAGAGPAAGARRGAGAARAARAARLAGPPRPPPACSRPSLRPPPAPSPIPSSSSTRAAGTGGLGWSVVAAAVTPLAPR